MKNKNLGFTSFLFMSFPPLAMQFLTNTGVAGRLPPRK
jgi:hypothetical protein